jgi:putative SOS response-associated peptidase YedK
MPLFLPHSEWKRWLDPQLNDESALRAIISEGLSPEQAHLVADPVSARVNKIANNGAELVLPIELGEQETLL